MAAKLTIKHIRHALIHPIKFVLSQQHFANKSICGNNLIHLALCILFHMIIIACQLWKWQKYAHELGWASVRACVGDTGKHLLIYATKMTLKQNFIDCGWKQMSLAYIPSDRNVYMVAVCRLPIGMRVNWIWVVFGWKVMEFTICNLGLATMCDRLPEKWTKLD